MIFHITITLPSTITTIGANAFAGCTSLTSINIPANVTSIGAGAFKDCYSLTNITIPEGVTYIGEGAFAGCDNLEITIDPDNTFYTVENNVLYDSTKTEVISSGKTPKNLTLPESVRYIRKNAFLNNYNLETIQLHNVYIVEDYAFANCVNIREVYFYNYTPPIVGIGVFYDCAGFEIYIPHSQYDSYSDQFVGYNENLSYIPITITFISDGDIHTIRNSYYGAIVNGLTEPPYKIGYNFAGWYDNLEYTGDAYVNGEGYFDSIQDITLYAKWNEKNYDIELDHQGGTGGNDNIEATYGELMGTMIPPTKIGYSFQGYYTEPNGEGVQYFNRELQCIREWDIDENTVLYAYWIANFYTAIFDYQGGTGVVSSMRVRYELPMPMLTAPTKVGYTLRGFYSGVNGTGVQYYDGTMQSVRHWDIAGDATIYAYWEANRYQIICGNLLQDMRILQDSYTYGVGLSTMPDVYIIQNASYVKLNTVYGWYADASLTTPITSISATEMGNKVLYIKYERFLCASSTTLNATVVEGDTFAQPYYQFSISVLNNTYYEQAIDAGLEHLKIRLTINYDELYDGYQEFYIYNGSVQLWSGEYDPGNKVETNVTYNSGSIIIDIENCANVNFLTVRFNAHGNFRDDWVVKTVDVEVYLMN